MNPKLPDQITPKNSFSGSFWAFITILLISSLTVLVLRHKPLWYEIEILASELILFLGSFYSYALYKGMNFEDEKIFFNKSDFSFAKITDWCDFGAGFDYFTSWGGEIVPIIGHIIGFLIDLIVAFILTMVISFFLWLGLNVILTGLVFLISVLYYFFKRSNSIVFQHQALCRGRIFFAVFYGLLYACFYTALICLLVFLLRPSH
jgi:hypothetical protein